MTAGSWIVISTFVGFIALIAAVFLKRTLGISYDKASIRSILVALLISVVLYFFLIEGTSPFEVGLSVKQKVAWSISIILLSNAALRYVAWMIWAVLRRYQLVKLPRFVFNLTGILLLVGVVLFVLKNVHNIELTGLLVTSTVLTAVIGLAFQDTLGNLISGVSIQVESPFAIDDWVNLGGHEGKVVSQNWRTLTLLTREHHRVSLTNKFIAEDKIINYSRPTRRQIHSFTLILDYQHPPNQVKNIILDMLDEIEEVQPHATLGAYVMDYKDNGIQYGMKYWLPDYSHYNETQDVVLSRLWYTLKRHNIKIPYPIQELQVAVSEVTSPTELKSKVQEEKREFLGKLAWLGRLKTGQLEALAKAATLESYGNGDIIIQQGEEGDNMFVIKSGIAKVYIATEGKKLVEVADKLVGEFLGEMSLLTGEARSATVKAYGDVDVLKVNKDAFTFILMQDKELLEDMIEGMKNYKSGLTRIIEEERSKRDTTTESATQIVIQKIKDYLALSA